MGGHDEFVKLLVTFARAYIEGGRGTQSKRRKNVKNFADGLHSTNIGHAI